MLVSSSEVFIFFLWILGFLYICRSLQGYRLFLGRSHSKPQCFKTRAGHVRLPEIAGHMRVSQNQGVPFGGSP